MILLDDDVLSVYNFAILFGNVMRRLFISVPIRERRFQIIELNFEWSLELLDVRMKLLFLISLVILELDIIFY